MYSKRHVILTQTEVAAKSYVTDPIRVQRVTGRFGPIPVRTPGRFGPIPFRSGRFGLGRFGPISGVGHFGPILVGCFGHFIFYRFDR